MNYLILGFSTLNPPLANPESGIHMCNVHYDQCLIQCIKQCYTGCIHWSAGQLRDVCVRLLMGVTGIK